MLSRKGALLLIAFTATRIAIAAEHHGTVTFGGFPVPGATVTATRGSSAITVITDPNGIYSFPNLADGTWKLHVEMPCFAPVDHEVTVGGAAAEQESIQLKLLPLDAILVQAQTSTIVNGPTPGKQYGAETATSKAAQDVSQAARTSEEGNEGLLVNGSSNNAATSKYSMDKAFGNQRSGSKALYTGGLAMHLGNSALDARPYSLTGLDQAKPSYDRVTMVASLGGPLRIPRLLPRGPSFSLIYQWTRDNTAQALSGLVPTLTQRSPTFTIDPVASALLSLYPLPNLAGSSSYNYQVPVVNGEHDDVAQLRLDKSFEHRDTLNGSFNIDNIRQDATSLFGFRDATKTLGMNAGVNWQHRLYHGIYGTVGYRFSRMRTDVMPQFMNRTNVSGAAGMSGNLQDASDWGPPTLSFSSGIAALSDAQSAFNRNRTDSVSYGIDWYRGRHNIKAGGDFRRQEFNYLQQVDPRGTFTFTGAAYGDDFTDFLRGVPDTASIAYGNADKYLRQSVYDVFANDDWRIRPDLTIQAGVRWDYGTPAYELKNRLVNLDVASGFTAVSQTLASDPTGTLSGQTCPRSLVRPDRTKVQPRLGLSWRPIPASSMVIRAGYGIYVDTSVYQQMAFALAQQAPLSHTVTANNSDCTQSLATGPTQCSTTTKNTFAVDPNFRVGYAQIWQLSVQRDLPWALQMTATYNGVRGADGVQEFLPNTYAPGATNPCSSCPVGFLYETSNGRSIRHAGVFQLRRRLRSGLTATAQYTYAHAIDNDAMLGGQGPLAAGTSSATTQTATIAQNWNDLAAERSSSSFDQRHLLNFTMQYTTGMGLGGGTLLQGWAGRLYKEWTVGAVWTAASGKPLTPVYLVALNGTGYTGIVRPKVTGISLYSESPGRHLNPDAYTAPDSGQFGNAGRFSINGPGILTLDASLSRAFRLTKKFNLDIRGDATNILNHPVFAAYSTTINSTLVSPTFGLPTSANAMRAVQVTGRLRF